MKPSAPDRVVIGHARETKPFEIVVDLHLVCVFPGSF